MTVNVKLLVGQFVYQLLFFTLTLSTIETSTDLLRYLLPRLQEVSGMKRQA